MNNRLRAVRKKLGLTQQEFADKLGVSRNNIAGYESGTRNPSDAAIRLVCATFRVNPDYIYNGNGDMFVRLTQNDILDEFLPKLAAYPDSFRYRFFEAMSRLDEDDWKYLELLAKKLVSKGEKQEDEKDFKAEEKLVAESGQDYEG